MSRGTDYNPEIPNERLAEWLREVDHRVSNMKEELEHLRSKIGKPEPDYLQAGDQWRDEEENEYVLAMWKRPDSVLHPYKFSLVNKETGKLLKSGQLNSRESKFINDCNNRTALGITDNMTKIK